MSQERQAGSEPGIMGFDISTPFEMVAGYPLGILLISRTLETFPRELPSGERSVSRHGPPPVRCG